MGTKALAAHVLVFATVMPTPPVVEISTDCVLCCEVRVWARWPVNLVENVWIRQAGTDVVRFTEAVATLRNDLGATS